MVCYKKRNGNKNGNLCDLKDRLRINQGRYSRSRQASVSVFLCPEKDRLRCMPTDARYQFVPECRGRLVPFDYPSLRVKGITYSPCSMLKALIIAQTIVDCCFRTTIQLVEPKLALSPGISGERVIITPILQNTGWNNYPPKYRSE